MPIHLGPLIQFEFTTQQPKVEASVGIGDVVNEAIKGFARGIVDSIR